MNITYFDGPAPSPPQIEPRRALPIVAFVLGIGSIVAVAASPLGAAIMGILAVITGRMALARVSYATARVSMICAAVGVATGAFGVLLVASVVAAFFVLGG